MTEVEVADDFIEHYGTKGMRWGVRRNLKKLPSSERGAYLQSRDAKWLAKVEAKPKLARVSRLAARYAKKDTKLLKRDYKERGFNIKKSGLARTRYDAELKNILETSLDRASYKVHKTSPSRLNEVQVHRYADGTITATVAPRTNTKIVKQFGKLAKADAKAAKAEVRAVKAEAKVAKRAMAQSAISDDDFVLIHEEAPTDAEYEGLEFFLVEDDEGFIIDIITPFGGELAQTDIESFPLEDALMHYGVPGMKWGKSIRSRKGPSGKVTKRPNTGGTPIMKTPPPPAVKRSKILGRKGKELAPKVLPKKELSDDSRTYKEIRTKAATKGRDSLSNAEMKKVTERFNLEKSYSKMLQEQKAAQKSPVKKAAKIAGRVLISEMGTTMMLGALAKHNRVSPALVKQVQLGLNLSKVAAGKSVSTPKKDKEKDEKKDES